MTPLPESQSLNFQILVSELLLKVTLTCVLYNSSSTDEHGCKIKS